MERLFVIKVGGNVIDDTNALGLILTTFSSIPGKKILIHGGGKIASTIASKLGIESKYYNGRRITDKETLEVVTMVYGGLLNKNIVAQLQKNNCNAIGLTGADANIIKGTKRIAGDVNFGFVGELTSGSVDTVRLNSLLNSGLTPVLAPLIHNGEGQMLNTNADTIASTIAIAMSTLYNVRLIYCFEKNGILENVNDPDSLISLLDRSGYDELKTSGKLFAGILPKIENALDAVDSGVSEVIIGSAEDLIMNISSSHNGTLITKTSGK